MNEQLSFLPPGDFPPGLTYQSDFITRDEEHALLSHCQQLTLTPYQYEGYSALRHITHYDLEALPEFLKPLLQKVNQHFGMDFHRVLITKYPVGAPIGWHRDAPHFGMIAGVSLGSSCVMQLRERKGSGKLNLPLARGSLYSMRGAARWDWDHHIPPAKEERWSITFRTKRNYSRYSSSAS